jgi:hypothetical protein
MISLILLNCEKNLNPRNCVMNCFLQNLNHHCCAMSLRLKSLSCVLMMNYFWQILIHFGFVVSCSWQILIRPDLL